MVKRLVADHPGLAFSDLEVSRAGQSYAVDTLSELQHVQPGDYWFIMGADALKSLPEWKQPNRLIKLCRLAVVARRPVEPEELLKRFPDEFRSAVDIVEMKPIDTSASDLRDKIARGQSVSQWIPKPVVQYIEEHKLYKF
jgi:nicotinate-nucleotide adenylyltransferase